MCVYISDEVNDEVNTKLDVIPVITMDDLFVDVKYRCSDVSRFTSSVVVFSSTDTYTLSK